MLWNQLILDKLPVAFPLCLISGLEAAGCDLQYSINIPSNVPANLLCLCENR